MSDEQKTNIANVGTTAIIASHQEGLISTATAMKELKQLSEKTGLYTNITDEEIDEAMNEPPLPMVENLNG